MFWRWVEFWVTSPPHPDWLMMQQVPNPEAQDPSDSPPVLAAHSEEVQHSPVSLQVKTNNTQYTVSFTQ